MVEPDDTRAAGGSHQLWFTPPVVNQDRRRALTRNAWLPRRSPSSPPTAWTR